jgi:hypothetical protein
MKQITCLHISGGNIAAEKTSLFKKHSGRSLTGCGNNSRTYTGRSTAYNQYADFIGYLYFFLA